MTRLKGYFPPVHCAKWLFFKGFRPTTTQLTLKQNAPTTYAVVKGDTLWDISAMYLKQPLVVAKLWDINPDIENPHLIYPGDQLYLVWNNGKPQLKFKPKVTLSPKVRKVKKQPVPIVEQGLVMPYLQSDRLIKKRF